MSLVSSVSSQYKIRPFSEYYNEQHYLKQLSQSAYNINKRIERKVIYNGNMYCQEYILQYKLHPKEKE